MAHSTCSVDGCDRPCKGYGYCNLHYQRFKKYGHPGEAPPRLVKTHRNVGPCSVDECSAPRFCKGLCTLHYSRMRGHGTPDYTPAPLPKRQLPPLICHWPGCGAEARKRIFCNQHAAQWDAENPVPKTASPDDRLTLRTIPHGGCLYFTGRLNPQYYGDFYIDGGHTLAHRVAWRIANGWAEIPDGKVIDHFTCYTPYCVAPDHLRLASPLENTHNRKGANHHNGTGLRGVTWYPQGKNWNARYELDGVVHNLGFFDDPFEASLILEKHRRENYAARGWDFTGMDGAA